MNRRTVGVALLLLAVIVGALYWLEKDDLMPPRVRDMIRRALWFALAVGLALLLAVKAVVAAPWWVPAVALAAGFTAVGGSKLVAEAYNIPVAAAFLRQLPGHAIAEEIAVRSMGAGSSSSGGQDGGHEGVELCMIYGADSPFC
jgi:hypothetical protein